MGQVWDLELPANEQSVLLAMADHADHDGDKVFPSNGLVAWKIGSSRDTVRRLKKKLEERGILVLVSEASGDVKRYRIDLSKGTLKTPYRPDPLQIATPSKVPVPPLQSLATPPLAKPCYPNRQKPSTITVNGAESVELPECLRTEEFKAAWIEWLTDRKKRGKKVTELAAEKQLEKLASVGSRKAIQSINQSIENGWIGLFEPRGQYLKMQVAKPASKPATVYPYDPDDKWNVPPPPDM